MNEALALSVAQLSVRMVTLGGERSNIEVFLHSVSGRHGGPETLGERLDGRASRFLPCQVAGGIEIINLDQVAYFDCPGNLPEIAELDALSTFRARATLELAVGNKLAGELRYCLPPTSCRISDLLNAPEDRFLLLASSDRCFYVNRRAVVRVRPEAWSCQ